MTTQTTVPAGFDYAMSKAISDATRSQFRPQRGGLMDECRETAVTYRPQPEGNTNWYWNENRRCARHAAIDKRTYEKRYGSLPTWFDEGVPFDAEAAKKAAIAKEQASRKARFDAFWSAIEEAVEDRDVARLRELVRR